MSIWFVFAVFGIFAFCQVLSLKERVSRLEQLLRENGIRHSSGLSLARQLRERIGQTVTLVQEDGVNLRCRILDVDEEWVQILTDEESIRLLSGQRENRWQEMLLRLECVEAVRG